MFNASNQQSLVSFCLVFSNIISHAFACSCVFSLWFHQHNFYSSFVYGSDVKESLIGQTDQMY